MKMVQDVFADAAEVFIDIRIGIAEHREALGSQKGISLDILLLSFRLIVLGTVQLDHQLLFRDIEIDDVAADDLLTVDRDGKHLQEVVPKVSLFLGHLPAEPSGIPGKALIPEDVHQTS